MGNCQAVDAATLVLQYPSGKVEKLYWPVSAADVMKMNPGHYVALLLSTTLYPTRKNGECPNTTTTTTANNNSNNSLRITRIKLLKPTDTLVLGHVYKLISTQEVMKGLLAKKQAKQKKNQPAPVGKPERREIQHSGLDIAVKRSDVEKDYQATKNETNSPRTATATNSASAAARSRTWQPSLQSISEATS
ncbi:hypothetical protein P3X46_031018 [Hevea brasiliensis]|uniref:Uncharacterized protein n=1 Tax=Hevea brasiliensis TaxID=3981 RepID=A0ABQ9KJY0_HEVBR|nr:uncharacterized protein LOC110660486 [Hevea brasiliensis]KAJ9140362.1 hypothetical protein P3X46_031018 [Hevea brasiliensis]